MRVCIILEMGSSSKLIKCIQKKRRVRKRMSRGERKTRDNLKVRGGGITRKRKSSRGVVKRRVKRTSNNSGLRVRGGYYDQYDGYYSDYGSGVRHVRGRRPATRPAVKPSSLIGNAAKAALGSIYHGVKEMIF